MTGEARKNGLSILDLLVRTGLSPARRRLVDQGGPGIGGEKIPSAATILPPGGSPAKGASSGRAGRSSPGSGSS